MNRIVFAFVFAALTLVFAIDPANARTSGSIGVALYGTNGHQLRPSFLAQHPHARLVAVACVRSGFLPPTSGVRSYDTLEELLRDPDVELVSLCSPRRADQAADAIRCLEAGKHVYAEKPSALTEEDLDAILSTARRTGRRFHEMAGTAFVQPYREIRQLVQDGAIGEVIQVFVQKSYPHGPARPQDEAVDGGLMLQVGIHAMRMVTHVAGQKIDSVAGLETDLGNPQGGNASIAASLQMRLENGGLATVIANYLNPPHLLPRGHETLRIFGTRGFIETVDGGTRMRLVTPTEVVPIRITEPSLNYFNLVVESLTKATPMPLTTEDELHPLRMLLRSKRRISTQ